MGNETNEYKEIAKSCLTIANKSAEENGSIPQDTQRMILEDIMQCFSASESVASLDDDEKKQYIDVFRKVLKHIDTELIYKAKGLNQYKKLYLIDLKYGEDVLCHSERKKAKFYYEGQAVFNLQATSILKIEMLRISGNEVHIEGLIGANATKMAYRLFVKDAEGARYDASIGQYGQPILVGLDGTTLIDGDAFSVDVKIGDGSQISFMLEMDGEEIVLNPSFSGNVGINKKEKANYCVNNGYIVKARKSELIFNKDTALSRFKCELRLRKSHKTDQDKTWQSDRVVERKIIKAVNDQRLRDRIAFVTIRNDGEPADNLGEAYKAVSRPKISFCSKSINKDRRVALKAVECIYSSKVVVTDDYLALFRYYGKKEGQYFVQLWHAAGAFKKFGADGTTMSLCLDALTHRDYDLVSVSSEYVREIYAKAFAIDSEKVRALGVPRCDRFFDKDYLESRKSLVYDLMPELKGKQIILYAPSFRGKGKNRIYLPEVDYKRINDCLNENQVMVLCPHPLTPEDSSIGEYDKVKLVREISTNDMMIAADLLITDYSSVIFDYSLLDKPMAFFCYDYDTYDRDFYLDYDNDLPGEVFKDIDSLAGYLTTGEFKTDDRLATFKDKYMSACDGHCSEKVARAIEELLDK